MSESILIILGSGYRAAHEQLIPRHIDEVSARSSKWVVFSIDRRPVPPSALDSDTAVVPVTVIRKSLDLSLSAELDLLVTELASDSSCPVYVLDSISCGFISSYCKELVQKLHEAGYSNISVAHYVSIFNEDPTNRLSDYSDADKDRVRTILQDPLLIEKQKVAMNAFFEHQKNNDFRHFFDTLRGIRFLSPEYVARVRDAIDRLDTKYIKWVPTADGLVNLATVARPSCVTSAIAAGGAGVLLTFAYLRDVMVALVAILVVTMACTIGFRAVMSKYEKKIQSVPVGSLYSTRFQSSSGSGSGYDPSVNSLDTKQFCLRSNL